MNEGVIGLTPITDREFKLIRELVYSRFGIALGDQKRSLVVGRLNKIIRQGGFRSFKEYYDYVVEDSSGKAILTLIDRISTNHTFFYRENDHFEYFVKTALPASLNIQRSMRKDDFRIWVAGCSSGEEPYTLGMLLMEALGKDFKKWKTGILATDISTQALEKSVAGIYSAENVAHLPKTLQNKYFKRIDKANYEVVDDLKKLITYRRLNLMRPNYPFKKKFHHIFCRNVMIYFDRPTRDDLVRKFYQYTEPGGFLFIGHSETLGRDDAYYQYIKPAIYRKAN